MTTEVTERTTETDDSSFFRPSKVPDFHSPLWRMDSDQWGDLLLRLEKENREFMDREFDSFRVFMTRQAVEFMFTLSVRLELPHEVRYLSLFIFDKYMSAQVTQLHREVFQGGGAEAEDAERWRNALHRFYAQSALRAVSCVSIACKTLYFKLVGLHVPDKPQTLSVRTQCAVLLTMNQHFDEEAVVKSENRVFSLVMFDLETDRNPVLLIESYLCLLVDQYADLMADVDPEAVWEYAILYTDFVFLNLRDFYSRLWKATHGVSLAGGVERERTWHLEADFILLAVSVVVLALYSLHGAAFASRAAELIGSLGVSARDVSLFLDTLRDMILGWESAAASPRPPQELLGLRKVNNPPRKRFPSS